MNRKRGRCALKANMKIGCLTLIEQCENWYKWKCKCSCDNIVVRDYSSLMRSKKLKGIASCGCMLSVRNLDDRIQHAQEKQEFYARKLRNLLSLKRNLAEENDDEKLESR